MKGMTLEQALDFHYPLARTCAHTSKKESLEQELADDRYYWIIVDRCEACNLPLGERYAENDEVERLQNETATR